ncbi:MAG: hypothetical protein WBU92_12035 [Candidatus Dormiibacterota bacterium]
MSEVDLSDLLPKVPLEELLLREALGSPGQPAVEVGLPRERFGEPRGRALSNRHLALLRALGGVSYPASRQLLLQGALPRLAGLPAVAAQLEALPEAQYGGELEVMRELELLSHHSARGGKDEGSGPTE